MDIVATTHRFLAEGLDLSRHAGSREAAEPLFVRPFVMRETHIAIDTPYTIFGLKNGQRGIKLRETTDVLRREVHETGVALLVPLFVLGKPFAVVVER